MDKQTSDIRLYTVKTFVRPKVQENISRDWVLNGVNNSFFQFIIDRYNGSPTNAAIINSYSDWIYGKGLSATNASVNTKDWLKLKAILKPNDLKQIITDFYMFGEASMQTIATRNGKNLSAIKHIPKQKVVPSLVNEDNEIENYFVSNDWTNLTKNPAVKFSAFGTSKDAIEIFVIRPYKAGKDYFSDPTYLSTLTYAETEEEIANLNINSIKNGLSAGYIINVPDGINLGAEEKEDFEKKIKRRLTGSPNASTFVLSFNGRDAEIKITPFPVNDNIHKQWQWLTDSARQQLITGHRVISPILFGIKDNTGLGNNADELTTAREEQMLLTINPLQTFILDALTEILEFYGINLDLFFKPLKEVVQTPTELKMSSDEDTLKMFDVIDSYAIDMSEHYDLTDGAEYDLLQLTANQTSEQDSPLWKIRYEYVKGTRKVQKGSTRAFCIRMLLLAAKGRVFRKEDIELMGMQGVNGQFAHSGGTYDIFLYAGGVNCYHRWERRIFKKKLNADGTPKKGGALASTTEVNVNEARRQGAPIPVNDPDVAIAEIDKLNNGRL